MIRGWSVKLQEWKLPKLCIASIKSVMCSQEVLILLTYHTNFRYFTAHACKGASVYD